MAHYFKEEQATRTYVCTFGERGVSRVVALFTGPDRATDAEGFIRFKEQQSWEHLGETVRVRIAVCVSKGGSWASAGDSHFETKEALQAHVDDCIVVAGDRITFIEADVPLPVAPAVIKGDVVQ